MKWKFLLSALALSGCSHPQTASLPLKTPSHDRRDLKQDQKETDHRWLMDAKALMRLIADVRTNDDINRLPQSFPTVRSHYLRNSPSPHFHKADLDFRASLRQVQKVVTLVAQSKSEDQSSDAYHRTKYLAWLSLNIAKFHIEDARTEINRQLPQGIY